ncbi:hypothetical protein SAMN04487857_102264 [Pseudomonas sp. ok272]|uniref:hypothetical protein n=1 Tax=unclassified Pseudomonas TaxID=196821 RepID=UPI0008C26840|nr:MULTISPECIES: hypothetical protein [unclassified Pseudomonas]SEM49131.1 hypothetical protein SAMN04487857_102264 [Pseudomonas sp. ok272]SFM20674.1 hypothetical protein SAMN04487858_101265 [Pseudomonas sp. ok602]
MNVKHGLVVAGLFCVMVDAQGGASGVIRFQGSIVEVGCVAQRAEGAAMELRGCPMIARSNGISVPGARPLGSVTPVGNSTANVQLKADSRQRDRFILVDATGKHVQSGAYIVTLTLP